MKFIIRIKLKLVLVFNFLFPVLLFGSNQTLIYKFNLKEEVSPGLARVFAKALKSAEEKKAAMFLIHMNTYGGMLDAADSIRSAILYAKIPVVVFIDNNAASAGALISIACDKIYMRSGSSFGAATVVNQQGEAVPDKYQSYMRAMMRATAEKRGRNPKIAEAMVDPRTYIEGINDSGKVLTFSANEAVTNNYCNGIVESVDELLSKENVTGYVIENFTPTLSDKIISFLINPAISGLLILVMMGGLYFEFQSPGTIFPVAAAALAAVLYFAPLYLEGMAANWEIILFAIGLILIAVEIFVIPGFGVAGISGIILACAGFILSMLNNDGFDFTFTSSSDILRAIGISTASMMASVFLFFYLFGKMAQSPRFSKIALQKQFNASDGYSIASTSATLVGKQGKALTPLRPAGKVIIENKVYDAVAQTGWIEASDDVLVIEQSLTITVKKT